MKVLLVNPPTRESEALNLGLAMIASVLRKSSQEVEVLDIHLLGLTEPEVLEELKRRRYDALGIGGLSNSFRHIRSIIHQSKSIKPHIPVVAGNMAVTASPQLFMQHTEADIAVIDEGEKTAVELFQAMQEKKDLKTVAGILLREGNGIFATSPRERIRDLDSLPFPAWDLFPMDRFFGRKLSKFGYSLNVSTTRGCPYDCFYCSRSFGRKVTSRSAESIVSEIAFLKKQFPLLDHILLGDDLFMTNKARNKQFCDLMIAKNIGVTWSAAARVDLVDEATLKLMKRAGCVSVSFGLESGSQAMLDAMNKCVKVERSEQALSIARRSGFQPEGSFILGYPGETRETLAATLDFIQRTELPPVKFFFATPYPGTRLYEIARQRGLIRDELQFLESLADNSEDLLVNFTEFSDHELCELKKWAENESYRRTPLMIKAKIMLDWFLTKFERARSRGFVGTLRKIAAKIVSLANIKGSSR